MLGIVVRALVQALSSPQVLALLERIVTAVIARHNSDQTAVIRAELGALEGRLMTELDSLSNRVGALEDRVSALEAHRPLERHGDPEPPGPPPHPPKRKP